MNDEGKCNTSEANETERPSSWVLVEGFEDVLSEDEGVSRAPS